MGNVLAISMNGLQKHLAHLHAAGWIAFALYLLAGFFLTWLLHRLFQTMSLLQRIPAQVSKLLERAISILLWTLISIQALRVIGVDIVSILGAAGVAGIAIGFASQTALSNVISGIFLITERSLKIGDYVKVAGQEGTVESINLLSLYLRQADNALIRIPCETLIKTPVINITKDEMRRCDFVLGVDYGCDLLHVRDIILNVVEDQPLLTSSPAPIILFSSFGDSSLNLQVGAWCKTKDYHTARLAFAAALLAAFNREGINIPFPTRSLLVENASPPASQQ